MKIPFKKDEILSSDLFKINPINFKASEFLKERNLENSLPERQKDALPSFPRNLEINDPDDGDIDELNVLREALNSDFSVQTNFILPFLPLLTKWIDLSLTLSEAFREGRYLDSDLNSSVIFKEDETDELGNVKSFKQYFRIPFVVNDSTSQLFLQIAELGVLLKKKLGQIPQDFNLSIKPRDLPLEIYPKRPCVSKSSVPNKVKKRVNLREENFKICIAKEQDLLKSAPVHKYRPDSIFELESKEIPLDDNCDRLRDKLGKASKGINTIKDCNKTKLNL